MRTDELDYTLPEELIAVCPPKDRDGGRLLVVDRDRGAIHHREVRALPELLPPNAVLVVNDTRVIRARLRGRKPSGGQVELLLVRARCAGARRWSAMARSSKPLRRGTELAMDGDLTVRVEGRDGEGLYDVTLDTEEPWLAIERCGELPLPPYMRRRAERDDEARYQTVFARTPGAVAAPTAGLHLTASMLKSLQDKGVTTTSVTLHVGPGTFLPVTADDLDAHPMHSEWFEISDETAALVAHAKEAGRPVVAVGTTVVRALESWALDGPRSGDTRLLIQPGYRFRVVDMLLTNFHLPRSTLLALVMAFGGVELLRRAYDVAVEDRYRFYSYGDAMLVR